MVLNLNLAELQSGRPSQLAVVALRMRYLAAVSVIKWGLEGYVFFGGSEGASGLRCGKYTSVTYIVFSDVLSESANHNCVVGRLTFIADNF